LENSVRLRFRLDRGVEDELQELSALERECCPFLVLQVEKSPGEAVLTIQGPPEAGLLLDDAFGGSVASLAVKAPAARETGRWAVVASAAVAALGVATCCVLPLGPALFGFGTAASMATVGAWIEPHLALASTGAGLAIAYGFYRAYPPGMAACDGTPACAVRVELRAMRAVLWLALILLVAGVIVK
jgi:hypothetical protein